MAFSMQNYVNSLYTEDGREILRKVKKKVKQGLYEVTENISKNTGIPRYYFSEGPDAVFLMKEPESEEYLLFGTGRSTYRMPNLFKSGTLGIYGETRKGKKLIGIKPKFVEGPYNTEKVREYKEALYFARTLRNKTKLGSRERRFLNDYMKLCKEEIRLMENPNRTARYILTHEPTHMALSELGVAEKIDTNTNEAITENLTQDSVGYAIFGPEQKYTKLKDWFNNLAGGIKGVYKTIKNYSDVPPAAPA